MCYLLDLYTMYSLLSSGENLNMFKEDGTKLLMYSNYVLDIVPEKRKNWSCVSDLLFTLTSSANENPSWITVKFDDMYIVNRVTFDSYTDPRCTESMCSPFSYQVGGHTCTVHTLAFLCFQALDHHPPSFSEVQLAWS